MFNFGNFNNGKKTVSENTGVTYEILNEEEMECEEVVSLDYLTTVQEGLTQENVLTTLNEADLMETFNLPSANELINNVKNANALGSTQRRAAFLARRSYLKLLELIENYNAVIANSTEDATINEFKNAKSQVQILAVVMRNIYKSIGGSKTNFGVQGMQAPSRQFCASVRKANSTLNEAISLIIRLKRVVNINSINRQLIIMLATLNNQRALVNSYLEICKR